MRASRTSRRSVVVLKELKMKSTAAIGDDRRKSRMITRLPRCIVGEILQM